VVIKYDVQSLFYDSLPHIKPDSDHNTGSCFPSLLVPDPVDSFACPFASTR